MSSIDQNGKKGNPRAEIIQHSRPWRSETRSRPFAKNVFPVAREFDHGPPCIARTSARRVAPAASEDCPFIYADSALVSGHGRLIVGEPDGLSDPTGLRLAVLPDIVLPDELPAATDADMLFLHLHARQALAPVPRQRREPARPKTRNEAGVRGRRRLRVLLVPHSG